MTLRTDGKEWKMDNTEEKPSKVKKIGTALVDASKEGAKLAAAREFAIFLQKMFSKILVEKMGMSEEDVNHPMVQRLLLGFSPALVLMLTEMFGDQIPHGDKIKAAAKVALTAVSAEIIGEILSPFTQELLNIIKQTEKVNNPSFERGLPEAKESELEVELKKTPPKKKKKEKTSKSSES